MKITDLKPDTKNSNKGNARGDKATTESLKRYGAGHSILVDADNRIIAGNHVAKHAATAGLEDVIVIDSDGSKLIVVRRTDLSLDDPKARELAIADNRSGQLGLEWNPEILGELVGDLDLQPFFSDEELQAFIPDRIVDLEDDEDSVPEFPVEPVTKLGDVYHLGDHRLMCGDSTVMSDVETSWRVVSLIWYLAILPTE